MKKIIIILVSCFMMVSNANAQNDFKMQAINNAINAVKCKLKAPSTFILTDEYGNKIKPSQVVAEYCDPRKTYYRVEDVEGEVVDSIKYFYTNTEELVDSVIFTSKKIVKQDTLFFKDEGYPYYRVSFYYEAENSYGGMVQKFAVLYIKKNEFISKYLDYDKPSFNSTLIRCGTKHIEYKPKKIYYKENDENIEL